MNAKKYITRNKKRSIVTIIGITLSSFLLISISIIFSSFREYLINNVKDEIGDYHVIIKGKIERDKSIDKIKYKEERYYIQYKNIYNTYKNTEKLCKKNCETITYNTHLLALYGVSKDKNTLKTIKRMMYLIITVLSIILFFIIYNSFKVNLNSRRKELCKLKLIGYTNSDIYKLYMKEALILFSVSIILSLTISIILNSIFINVLNEKLYELLKGNLKLKIYISFIIAPITASFIIVFLSALIPLKNVKKYKIMELFRINEPRENIKVYKFKSFPLLLSVINYERRREKYKSLIICIFISCLSINITNLILNYSLKSLKEFVIIPKYDLKIMIEGDYDTKKLAESLEAKKYITYKSCEKVGYINKKESPILITDLEGNELINKVNKIEKDKKITHIEKKLYKSVEEVKIDEKILNDIKLTNKIPMGFDQIEKVVINLNKEEFKNVCDSYSTNLVLNTEKKAINEYLDDLIKTKDLPLIYINVKKARQITESIITMIKVTLKTIYVMIFLVIFSSAVSIAAASTKYRKREFSRLKSIGLEPRKIKLSLIIESLIVTLKGWFYSLPFIFIINKYIFLSINEIFTFKKMLLNIDSIIYTLIASFILITLSIIITYKIDKNTVIQNIKM